jgi:acyl carrier protein
MSDEMELDSMDVLSLVTEIHSRTGVEIPESDYPLIDTVAALADYLVGAN